MHNSKEPVLEASNEGLYSQTEKKRNLSEKRTSKAILREVMLHGPLTKTGDSLDSSLMAKLLEMSNVALCMHSAEPNSYVYTTSMFQYGGSSFPKGRETMEELQRKLMTKTRTPHMVTILEVMSHQNQKQPATGSNTAFAQMSTADAPIGAVSTDSHDELTEDRSFTPTVAKQLQSIRPDPSGSKTKTLIDVVLPYKSDMPNWRSGIEALVAPKAEQKILALTSNDEAAGETLAVDKKERSERLQRTVPLSSREKMEGVSRVVSACMRDPACIGCYVEYERTNHEKIEWKRGEGGTILIKNSFLKLVLDCLIVASNTQRSHSSSLMKFVSGVVGSSRETNGLVDISSHPDKDSVFVVERLAVHKMGRIYSVPLKIQSALAQHLNFLKPLDLYPDRAVKMALAALNGDSEKLKPFSKRVDGLDYDIESAQAELLARTRHRNTDRPSYPNWNNRHVYFSRRQLRAVRNACSKNANNADKKFFDIHKGPDVIGNVYDRTDEKQKQFIFSLCTSLIETFDELLEKRDPRKIYTKDEFERHDARLNLWIAAQKMGAHHNHPMASLVWNCGLQTIDGSPSISARSGACSILSSASSLLSGVCSFVKAYHQSQIPQDVLCHCASVFTNGLIFRYRDLPLHGKDTNEVMSALLTVCQGGCDTRGNHEDILNSATEHLLYIASKMMRHVIAVKMLLFDLIGLQMKYMYCAMIRHIFLKRESFKAVGGTGDSGLLSFIREVETTIAQCRSVHSQISGYWDMDIDRKKKTKNLQAQIKASLQNGLGGSKQLPLAPFFTRFIEQLFFEKLRSKQTEGLVPDILDLIKRTMDAIPIVMKAVTSHFNAYCVAQFAFSLNKKGRSLKADELERVEKAVFSEHIITAERVVKDLWPVSFMRKAPVADDLYMSLSKAWWINFAEIKIGEETRKRCYSLVLNQLVDAGITTLLLTTRE